MLKPYINRNPQEMTKHTLMISETEECESEETDVREFANTNERKEYKEVVEDESYLTDSRVNNNNQNKCRPNELSVEENKYPIQLVLGQIINILVMVLIIINLVVLALFEGEKTVTTFIKLFLIPILMANEVVEI